MFRRIVATALLAGLVAGIVVSLAQQAWVAPLILQAETFEQQAAGSGAGGDTGGGADASGEPWAPEEGMERTLFSGLANVLTGIGFALLLAGAIALSGREVDWRRGLLWGLAGYVAFGLAPALGLPPDPPGVDVGPLGPRQSWWLGTAAATIAGLWLLVFATRRELKALGILVLIVPHAVGAPTGDAHGGVTPSELIDEFIVASLVTTALFWLVLGGISGLLYRRFA